MHHDGYGAHEPAFHCHWVGCPFATDDYKEQAAHANLSDAEHDQYVSLSLDGNVFEYQGDDDVPDSDRPDQAPYTEVRE